MWIYYSFLFRYAGIGKLNVLLWSAEGRKVVWSKIGNSGNAWLNQGITLVSKDPFSVVFEVVKGPKYTSAVAIDDILFLDGSCETLTTPSISLITQPPTPGNKLQLVL